MLKQNAGLVLCIASLAVGATAQTNTFPASGNVGIGTTSPAYPLDVSGNTRIGSTVYLGANGNNYLSTDGISDYLSTAGAQYFITNGNVYRMVLNGYGLTINNGSTAANSGVGLAIASGNVGIGTVSPTTRLSINGGISLWDGGIQTLNGGAVTEVNSQLIDFGMNEDLNNRFGGTYTPTDQGGLIRFDSRASYPLFGVFGRSAGSTSPMSQLLAITSGGNVGIGTTSPGATLEVNGNVKLTSNSGASITFADGTVQGTAYTGVTCGGDFAESVDVSGMRNKYEAGDVLVLAAQGDGDVARSSGPYSTLVAGIYSTRPGYVGRRLATPKSPDEIPMAMVGIVPTKVSAENGSIHRGDLLVTASLEGYAMKGTDRSRMLGAVLGKAMGSLDSGTGVIEVLVTLQ